jgi:peptidoglycan L-alanyl-D-glutamate endopeptidase CwlK
VDTISEKHLDDVHPDLCKVIKEASQEYPFAVVDGLRTMPEQVVAVQTKHSKTLRSRHLAHAQYKGLACAVDVIAIIDGKKSYAKGKEKEVFTKIADSIKQSAEKLSIPIVWGGDWKTFKDWGHFELSRAKYP